MNKIKLLSKARTLQALSKVIKSAKILPIFTFKVSSYLSNQSKILNKIDKLFKGNLIIRSSSKNEDNFEKSNAGKFVSISNIDVNDKQALKKSIEMVINSFGKDKKKMMKYLFSRCLKM